MENSTEGMAEYYTKQYEVGKQRVFAKIVRKSEYCCKWYEMRAVHVPRCIWPNLIVMTK